MARIPAICENCHAIFPTGVNLENGASNIVFENCGAGPCPKCGGDGRILNGVYNAVGEAIKAFIGQQDINVLRQLLELLILAKKEEWSREKVVDNITKSTPALSKIADWLPKSRTDLYAFIVIIIMTINTLINSGRSTFTKDELVQHSEITINNYYENNSENKSVTNPTLQIKDIPIDKKRVGRNEPCPCGSNKKFKKCCGR